MGILLIFVCGICIMCLAGTYFDRRDKAKEEERQRGITNQARNAMLSRTYMEKRDFHCGWAVVKLADYRYAYVNPQGEYLTNEIFVMAEDFKDGTAIVRGYDKGIGIIDTNGHFVLPYENYPKVDTHIKKLRDGIYEYTKKYYKKPSHVEKTEIFIIKQNGDFITKSPISKLIELKDDYIKYSHGKLIYEIDFSGNLLSRPFQKKVSLGNGLYRVMEHDYSWGIYDENIDKIIIPCKYSSILYFEPLNLFIIKPYSDGERAYPAFAVNRDNKIIIPQEFDHISILERKHIVVSQYNKKQGHGLCSGIYDINRQCLIAQPLYGQIWVSDKGTIMTGEYDGRCGIIKENGYSDLEYDSFKMVCMSEWDCSEISFANYTTNGCKEKPYTELFSCKPSFLIVSKQGKFGVIDLDNNIVIPFIYDSIESVEGKENKPTHYIVCNGSHYGVLDLEGNSILPIIYTKIESHREGANRYIPMHNMLDGKTDMWRDFEEMDCFDKFLYGKDMYFEVTEQNGDKKFYSANGHQRNLGNKSERFTNAISTKKTHSSSDVQDNNILEAQYIKKQNRTILFFDTETTGLPQNYNAPINDTSNWPRLVQLSWIVAEEDGTIIRERDYIIKPEGFIIPKDSSDVHGITTERASNEGVGLYDVLDEFLKDLNTSDYIVGHNIDFDVKVVCCELYRNNVNNALYSKRRICTMKSTTDLCKIPGKYGYKYPKLQELYKKLFNRNFVDAHNSAADVKATFECYLELKKKNLI